MGQASSIFSQFFPPTSHFNVSDIPDLSGKVVIVTGGASGIGKETAKQLLLHNATVYIAARSKARADPAIHSLTEETGKQAFFLEVDLASLASVRRGAEDFLKKESRLDILFNNGGVMVPPMSELTADGYDLQIGTNVLGHFYFTKLLLPTLLNTAKSSPDDHVRIVNTSSLGSLFDTYRVETFISGAARDKETPQSMYNQSKFGNVVFSCELHRRYAEQGIISASLNPGNLKTDLHRNYTSIQHTLANMMLYPAPFGALTQLWAGTSTEGLDLGGKYLIPWARQGNLRPEASDVETGKKLWEWCEGEVFKFEKGRV